MKLLCDNQMLDYHQHHGGCSHIMPNAYMHACNTQNAD